MTEEEELITNYFTQSAYDMETLENVNNYSKEVLGHIITDIAEGTLDVNEKPGELSKERLAKVHARNHSSNQGTVSVDAIRKLEREKDETIDKLNRIYEEEKRIRAEQQNSTQRRTLHPMEKSLITTEEKVKIKRLVKAKQEFECQLQSKISKIMTTVE